MAFARCYQPAVVFAEDVDRVTDGERDVNMDDILNTIDGVESKGTEIITILTTNHVENIDQAMLRPGRLDSVISVSPPDAAAAQKLVKIYARGLISENECLDQVGKELDGQIPAVIREVVERSKLAAIKRLNPGEPLSVTQDDLVVASRGMKHHLELLQVKAPEPTAAERLATALHETVLNGSGEKIESHSTALRMIGEHLALDMDGVFHS